MKISTHHTVKVPKQDEFKSLTPWFSVANYKVSCNVIGVVNSGVKSLINGFEVFTLYQARTSREDNEMGTNKVRDKSVLITALEKVRK